MRGTTPHPGPCPVGLPGGETHRVRVHSLQIDPVLFAVDAVVGDDGAGVLECAAGSDGELRLDSAVVEEGGLHLGRVVHVTVPPAAQFERLPGGWGVTMDDIAAGVYAGISTWAVVWAIANYWPV